MGLGNDLLNVGLSGLLTAQRALNTTAHNIANVNTPGYSRQNIEVQARAPQWTGAGYIGLGADVVDIRRSYDQFLTREVQLNTAAAANYRVQHQLAAELDTLLGQPETGVGQVLQDFFNAIEDVANDPASLSARQLTLDQARQLAQRFRAIDSRLQQLQQGVQTRAQATVQNINGLATSIAQVNAEIVAARGTDGQPNDLLDQRDELVRQLAEHVAVTTVPQDDGSLNVFIGSGQNLVMGGEARQLAVVRREQDPTGLGIAFVDRRGTSFDATAEIRGGELGALLAFEDGILAEAQRRLDQLALGLAEQFNAQHQLGMNLDGNLGGLFFTDVNAPGLKAARSSADASNTGSATLAVTVTEVGRLANSDYRLAYDGSQYTLTREHDEQVVGSFTTLSQTFADEGFSIELASGAMASGDSFAIRPAAGASRELEVMVPDGRSLALASPLRTAASATNLGDAAIEPTGVADLVGTPLSAPITLTYDAAGAQFVLSDPPGGTLAYDPATDSGTSLSVDVPGFGSLSFAMRGTPLDGDSFSIETNAGGSGDNSNALLIADLQNQRALSGGNATLSESYAHTVSDVASHTGSLERTSAAQTLLLGHAEDVRASYSGVNLDEEAANLMRYQQAYEASARLLSVSNEVFQSLLRAFGG